MAVSGESRALSTRALVGQNAAPVWLALALVLAVCLAYSPAIRAPFIFDDIPSIVENSTIRKLWPPSLPLHPPSGGNAVSGRPVANYSLAADYGLNAALGVNQSPGDAHSAQVISFRATNILIHLFCGALLFGIIRRTLRSPTLITRWGSAANRIAATSVAIWLLHPLQSEAVNYVVQRTELLVSMFWLGTLYAWIRAWDAERRQCAVNWRLVAVASCLLGMMSKEVMIGAPLMLVLYDRVVRVPSWRETLASRERAGFYALLASTTAWIAWSIVTGARAASVGFDLSMPWYRYLYSQGWAVAHYVRLFFWPHPLLIDYGKNPVVGLLPLPGTILIAACGVGTLWAWTRIDRWGWLGFAGAWFFLLLAPSSSVVPITSEIAAERRIYLALAAVVVVLVVGAESLRQTIALRSKRWRLVVARFRGGAGVVVIGLCALLVALTFERSSAYANPELLWREVIDNVPANARGYSNLGQILTEQPSRFADAESLFTRAIALDSSLTTAWINLAYLHTKEGRLSDAERELRFAMRIADPETHEIAVERYGRTLLGMGEVERGMPFLERAVSDRTTAENLFWLGLGYLESERFDDAAISLRRALSINPDFAIALPYLGRALIEGGHATDAVPYLQRSVERETRSPLNLALLSLAYASLGRTQEALSAATATVTIGSNAEASVFAGRAMMLLHRAKDARGYFAAAIRIHPDDWIALTRLGLADAELGDTATAERVFRRALALAPGYQAAREALTDLQRRPRR